jgi:signal transduction histidine kinase
MSKKAEEIVAAFVAPAVAGTAKPGETASSARALCHDLINPAASIKLLTEVLLATPDFSAGAEQRLHAIADEADWIMEICSHTLDRRAQDQVLPLDLIVGRMVNPFRVSYRGRIEVNTEPVSVAASSVAVARILTNLLENATRAAGTGGCVRVSVRGHADVVELLVEDSGWAHRAGRTGKASLGLAIVSDLVAELRGRVDIGRSTLGGAEVVVRLPSWGGTGTALLHDEAGSIAT